MKIIRPVHILSGDLWGGAEAQVYLLCNELEKKYSKEVVPSVVLFNYGDLCNKLLEANISTAVTEERKGLLYVLKNSFDFARKQKANLIITHGYKEGIVGFILTKLLQIPWIHYIHGTSENYTGLKKIKMSFYALIERFMMRFSASRIVTVSRKIALDLNIADLDKHRVIYNAADTHYNNQSLQKNNKQIKILWLGRLSPVKRPDLAVLGFQYFLEHFKDETNSIFLDIYGTGPLEENIKELCSGKARINLCGFTDTPQKIISESDILLLTSDSEGIPTVVLEAIHAKIPVVSRVIGGIPEIISIMPDYPIIQIKDSSTKACGLAILEAVNDLGQLQDRAQKSDPSYFGVKRLIEDNLTLYGELL